MSKLLNKAVILVFLLVSLLTISGCKKKIKFNLSGGQDFDGLAAYLDKQKEDNQLGL